MAPRRSPPAFFHATPRVASRGIGTVARPRALIQWLMCLALWLVAAPSTVRALGDTRPLDEYALDAWSTAEGLPHNLVTAIAQTPEGYLWFGTWEGLVRYNGREFALFDRASVPQLRDSGVRALVAAADGTLWVGTSRGGVARLRDGEWSVLGPEDGLPSAEIIELGLDRRGRVWVAMESEGVAVREDDGHYRRFTINEGLPSNSTSDLALDGDTVWVASSHGISRIVDGKVRAFGESDGLPPGDVTTVLVRRDRSVWCGTERGVYRFDGQRFIAAFPDSALSTVAIARLSEDAAGTLWIGTATAGVSRVRGAVIDQLTVDDGLPNGRVSALYEDHEGSQWLGTNGGLVRLKDTAFTTFLTRHGLPDNYVRSVLDDGNGTIWVGTSHGLGFWREGRFGHFSTADGLHNDSVLSLMKASDGALWVGFYTGGVDILRDGQIRHLGIGDGLPGSQVRALAQTRDGSIWIGTGRGLARWRDERIEVFTAAQGLPRNFVLSLFADTDGSLWVGTANGLAHLRDGRAEPLSGLEAFDVQDVFGFHRDRDGLLWIATDRGVLLYRDGKFSQVAVAQHLARETIFAIVEDEHGYFWLTSNRGIFRVARADLLSVAQGQQPTISGTLFAEPEGLASAQCNGGSQPSAIRDARGNLWFATARGVARIGSDHLLPQQPPPPRVVIEELRVDERSVDPNRAQILTPGTRKVEFRFAALTYLSPANVRYRYRLAGFDNEWLETRRAHSAQYTNLKPGEYRFEVTAANEHGLWNARPAQVVLLVEPAFWQTWWFLAAVVASLAGIAAAVFQVRLAQLRHRARQLEHLVESRTRDIEAQKQDLIRADREKSELLERLRVQADAFERQAREDGLTGLANRREFDARYSEAFSRCRAAGKPLAVALIDIDFFKRINDGFSHAVGDEVLRVMGQMLREAAGGDAIAARYGGEEFAIAFPGLDAAAAVARCEVLRQCMATHDFSAVAPGLVVTLSAGVSDRADVSHHERLLAFADQALYRAKHGGRDRVAT